MRACFGILCLPRLFVFQAHSSIRPWTRFENAERIWNISHLPASSKCCRYAWLFDAATELFQVVRPRSLAYLRLRPLLARSVGFSLPSLFRVLREAVRIF